MTKKIEGEERFFPRYQLLLGKEQENMLASKDRSIQDVKEQQFCSGDSSNSRVIKFSLLPIDKRGSYTSQHALRSLFFQPGPSA